MTPTSPTPDELPEVMALAAREAARYLGDIDERDVRASDVEQVASRFAGALPDEGVGALAAVEELVAGFDGAVHSAGPRFFHFVNGGTTPAALGADWLTSALDQNAGAWVATPLGAQLERRSLAWLRELFGLPGDWGGVLTTGATMANFVALACARRWWGLRHGVDVEQAGLSGLPPMPVFGSGYVHPSDIKALSMLGIGRANIHLCSRDGVGRLDLEALERALRELDGAPAVVIGSAGEVNAGDFDPIAAMAELSHRYGAWFHVDGAFGLFAGLSPRSAHLVEGVAQADSVIADGHKWLNVPYDCGFAFVRDASLQPEVFARTAAYLPEVDEERPSWGYLGPEMSRRARGIDVWATLRAYGRSGYRAIVEQHLDLAARLADQVDAAPELERLAEVPLNIVCFRARPPGFPEELLDELNRRIGAAAITDGRVFFGSTVYDDRVAFRPAPVSWRNRPADIDLIVEVVRELAAELAPQVAASA